MSQSRGTPGPIVFFLGDLILDTFGLVPLWSCLETCPCIRALENQSLSRLSAALHRSVVQESLCCCSSATSLDGVALFSRWGWLVVVMLLYYCCSTVVVLLRCCCSIVVVLLYCCCTVVLPLHCCCALVTKGSLGSLSSVYFSTCGRICLHSPIFCCYVFILVLGAPTPSIPPWSVFSLW